MLTVKSPWEVSQQRGMVVRVDTEGYLGRALALPGTTRENRI
jgi:hypothetical protein